MSFRWAVLTAITAALSCAQGNELPAGDGGRGGGVETGGTDGEGGAPAAGGAMNQGGVHEGGAPPQLEHGVLVITEIMADPDTAADTFAEWFEILNAATFPIPLDGLVLRHDATDPAAVLILDSDAVLEPGEYFVFGKSLDMELNGGVAVDYLLPASLSLTNTGDYLAFETEDGTILDHTFWGQAPNGASLSLDPTFLDATLNDDDTHYCPATSPLPSGDTGTPGEANDACP